MFKTVGIIIWVLGGLSNLVLFFRIGDMISLIAVVISCIGVFLNGLIFWSIGTLFEELDSVRDLVYSMKSDIINSMKPTSSKQPTNSIKSNRQSFEGKVWTCPKCQTTNSRSSITCKVCGNYR